MNFWPPRFQEFAPPPFANDVATLLGPYPRHEIVEARETLINAVQTENSGAWRNIKGKCGILPDGRRVRCEYRPQLWLPQEIPESWFAPISLVHVIEDDGEGEVAKTSKRKSIMSGRENKTSSQSSPTIISVDCLQDEEAIVVCDSSTPQYEADAKKTDDGHCEQNGKTVGTPNNVTSKSRDCSHTNDIVATNHRGCVNHDLTRCQNTDKDKIKNSSLASPQSSLHPVRSEVNGEKKNIQPVPSNNHDNDFEVWGSVPEKFVSMYKCDVCSFTFLKCADAQRHLTNFDHYSASSCVGRKSRVGPNSLIPIYMSAVSTLRCKQGLFNKVVPVCPKCYDVFPDVASCCSHTRRVHGLYGAYTMRDVRVKRSLVVTINPGMCTECGQVFKSKSLKKHWKVTGHMPVNVPTKCASEMTFFVCGVCSSIFYSFLQCREHIYRVHVDHETVVTAYTLEPATPVLHLLPSEPGKGREKTDRDVITLTSVAYETESEQQKRKCQFHVQQNLKKMRQESHV